MYEDKHVIELADRPGWVSFKAHPDVVIELTTYHLNQAKELQVLEQTTADLRRKIIRRIKTICRERQWPMPDQGGLRILSWNLIRLKQQQRAVDMPKGITNFSSDVYHWQHLINATALCTCEVDEIDPERQDLIISAMDYLTGDRLEMLESRLSLLQALDKQLDSVLLKAIKPQTKRSSDIDDRVERLEGQINEILKILKGKASDEYAGAKKRGVRAGKGRSKLSD